MSILQEVPPGRKDDCIAKWRECAELFVKINRRMTMTDYKTIRTKPLVPVLNDASRYWSDTDWQAVAEHHEQTIHKLHDAVQQANEDRQAALFDAGIYRVVALCGWAAAILAVVWRVL